MRQGGYEVFEAIVNTWMRINKDIAEAREENTLPVIHYRQLPVFQDQISSVGCFSTRGLLHDTLGKKCFE